MDSNNTVNVQISLNGEEISSMGEKQLVAFMDGLQQLILCNQPEPSSSVFNTSCRTDDEKEALAFLKEISEPLEGDM